MTPPPANRSLLLSLLSVLLALTGLWFVGGGAWLLSLGGSLYYVVAGVVLLVVAVLVWNRYAGALWLYATFFFATLLWSMWETGLAWWPLAARTDVFFLFGLALITPWVGRRLRHNPSPEIREPDEHLFPGWHSGRSALAVVITLYVSVALATWLVDPTAVKGTLTDAPRDASVAAGKVPEGEWHAYGRTGHGQRHSPLSEIQVDNIGKLEVAWHYHTGDTRGQPGDPEETTFQVTPLKVGNRLFICTPHHQAIALDATTGKELWRYDPKVQKGLALQHQTCRGLSYTPARTAPDAVPDAPFPDAPALPVAAQDNPAVASCTGMLFLPTADGRVIALDPASGAVCSAFGGGTGQISLWRGMPNVRLGGYYSTSPVVVSERVLVVGGTVLDNTSTREPSGVVRGYDVRTGALLWNWDPATPEGDTAPIQPGQKYVESTPNVWSIMSVDEELGMVYLPVGNPTTDQWGGQRSEATGRVGSSVVALDLGTGRLRWVFQTVHHDLWDYDVPSQPTLVDLTIEGNKVPALVQPTKQGELFVLDRRTGEPLHAVSEVPVPQGAASGDRTAPTQPVSALSFEPPPLTGKSMWGATPLDQLFCRIAFQRLRYEGRYTPPSTQGSLVYPGNFGVFNWGGIAVDPDRQIAFTTPAYLAFTSQLVPRPDHTTQMVQKKDGPEGALPALNENFGAPFAVKMAPFVSPLGIPCQAPPWGYVAGVDLNTGRTAWKYRNGTVRDVTPVPLPFSMGVPSLGGPLLTGGGIAFLSGTIDNYLRAYDVTNGKQIWQARLPAGGQATPMSYTGEDGRQYVVVAAGGHGSLGTKAGDSVIAYALPRAAPAR